MLNDKNTSYTKVAFISLSVLQRYNLNFNERNFSKKFLLKMNFIILKIIFRKYLHISKILLFAHTLFIIKNFYQISTH